MVEITGKSEQIVRQTVHIGYDPGIYRGHACQGDNAAFGAATHSARHIGLRGRLAPSWEYKRPLRFQMRIEPVNLIFKEFHIGVAEILRLKRRIVGIVSSKIGPDVEQFVLHRVK